MGARQELTGKRREILDFIADQLRERGYPPSVREIGEADWSAILRSAYRIDGDVPRSIAHQRISDDEGRRGDPSASQLPDPDAV